MHHAINFDSETYLAMLLADLVDVSVTQILLLNFKASLHHCSDHLILSLLCVIFVSQIIYAKLILQ